jgi:transcriptional regulator with XRE-family HTH domain
MARLKEFREKSGLSQLELAKEINISVRTLQAYEQNQREFAGAKLDTILKTCIILKCTLKEMFADNTELLNLLEKQQ